jgi:hypothetical protein
MVRHPSTGWNLLMAGADLLDEGTGTPAVSQRSESGQGILGAKAGRGGMLLWSAMVMAVLSSRMSAGGCSLARRRDDVPCLAITANFVMKCPLCCCVFPFFFQKTSGIATPTRRQTAVLREAMVTLSYQANKTMSLSVQLHIIVLDKSF